MTTSNRFDKQVQGDVAIIHLKDPNLSDTLMVSELEEELLRFVEEEQVKNLIVNFAGVGHCSTSVINGLLRAKKRLMQSGGAIRLCGMKPVIREAYRILNLDGTVFQICDDVASAMRSIRVAT